MASRVPPGSDAGNQAIRSPPIGTAHRSSRAMTWTSSTEQQMPAAHNNAVAVSGVSLAMKSAIAPQAALASSEPARLPEWRSPWAISRTWHLYWRDARGCPSHLDYFLRPALLPHVRRRIGRRRRQDKPDDDASVHCFATARGPLAVRLPNFGRRFGVMISPEQRTPVFPRNYEEPSAGVGVLSCYLIKSRRK